MGQTSGPLRTGFFGYIFNLLMSERTVDHMMDESQKLWPYQLALFNTYDVTMISSTSGRLAA